MRIPGKGDCEIPRAFYRDEFLCQVTSSHSFNTMRSSYVANARLGFRMCCGSPHKYNRNTSLYDGALNNHSRSLFSSAALFFPSFLLVAYPTGNYHTAREHSTPPAAVTSQFKIKRNRKHRQHLASWFLHSKGTGHHWLFTVHWHCLGAILRDTCRQATNRTLVSATEKYRFPNSFRAAARWSYVNDRVRMAPPAGTLHPWPGMGEGSNCCWWTVG